GIGRRGRADELTVEGAANFAALNAGRLVKDEATLVVGRGAQVNFAIGEGRMRDECGAVVLEDVSLRDHSREGKDSLIRDSAHKARGTIVAHGLRLKAIKASALNVLPRTSVGIGLGIGAADAV